MYLYEKSVDCYQDIRVVDKKRRKERDEKSKQVA
jgi:hypothetical protein